MDAPPTGAEGTDRPQRVALFASCAVDLAMPGPALAAIRVLEAAGFAVDVPRAQTCCGQVALNSGYPDQAAPLMRRWIDVFEPYDAVVGVSGSCTATVRHHFGRILAEHDAARAERVGSRLWEFTQFVARFGGDLELSLDTTVTYHDSCHMLRTLGEKKTPREVLSHVDGLRLNEAREREVCCGFGGTFAVKFPEVSCAMADLKLDDVASTGADVLVAADSTCLMHLQARADARSTPLRTAHVAEVLAAALPADRFRPAGSQQEVSR